ncbi:MAG: sporulation protein YqfD [Bacillota bacterium]
MFLFRLVSFLFGYVSILVRGENLEKFLNMAASRGIFLWDIRKVGQNEIFVKTRLSAVRPLRHIGRSTRTRFAFKNREGLPFMISRVKKRKSIVIGAVLFLLGLYVLSSFVWSVEVKGNRSLASGEILDIAAQAGLKVGSFKLRVDEERVEELIRERLPEVSYVGVNVSGTRATIEIAEKIIMQKKEAHPSDIVACKSGLIKEVLVLVGNPAVKEGDTVVPGQVLISGVIPPPETQSPNPPGNAGIGQANPLPVSPPTYVKARGVVRARVWYEGYGEAPLQEEAARETGSRLSRVRIKIGDKEIILSGAQNIPFGNFKIERSVKKPPSWRNLSIPVEVISEDYYEVEKYRIQRSRIEALELARKKALESARSGMNNIRGEYHAFEEKTGEISSKNPENIVRVRAYIETLEDIGVEKPIK